MPITIKWDEAHARYTVSEPNWPGGEVVPAAVLADFRSIIANVAEALMPDSPKDSREAEFAIDGMGACQIIRRRTSELLSARKRIVELESDARTGEELDRDDAMLLEALLDLAGTRDCHGWPDAVDKIKGRIRTAHEMIARLVGALEQGACQLDYVADLARGEKIPGSDAQEYVAHEMRGAITPAVRAVAEAASHTFTEIETQESMDAELTALRAQLNGAGEELVSLRSRMVAITEAAQYAVGTLEAYAPNSPALDKLNAALSEDTRLLDGLTDTPASQSLEWSRKGRDAMPSKWRSTYICARPVRRRSYICHVQSTEIRQCSPVAVRRMAFWLQRHPKLGRQCNLILVPAERP